MTFALGAIFGYATTMFAVIEAGRAICKAERRAVAETEPYDTRGPEQFLA